MFGIMTTGKKREILISAIDGLQGHMTERGSLSSNAEKLGKEILRVFRSQITAGQPATEGKNLTFAITTGDGAAATKELNDLLAKEGAGKSIMDLNAAFGGKLNIEKNSNGTFTLSLKASK